MLTLLALVLLHHARLVLPSSSFCLLPPSSLSAGPTQRPAPMLGTFIMLLENLLSWASHLGHTDMNIRLLQSHAAAKLLHVKGTTNPWDKMYQGMPKGAGPTMFIVANETHPLAPTCILRLIEEEPSVVMSCLCKYVGTVLARKRAMGKSAKGGGGAKWGSWL